MHVSDALISPTVALGGAIVATGLIALSSKKIKDSGREDIVPLMGVLGAFVFAAQMINFTIPGTGSSGHLIGGILLAAMLGPWSAFITLCSILIVQCLIFADGGLLALGCNIINMAATSCLIAYPLIYRPIVKRFSSSAGITVASVISSVVALELGAFLVTMETELSGITALPVSTFLSFMLPIHLAIGAIEGLVTAVLLMFVAKNRPQMLEINSPKAHPTNVSGRNPVIWVFLAITLIFAGGFTVLASEYPDGLEWSIDKIAGIENFESSVPPTALMPDYDSGLSGIIGAVIVMVLLWGVSSLLLSHLRKAKKEK